MEKAKRKITVEYIKKLGAEKNTKNFNELLELYYSDLSIELKREVVSSIGRQSDLKRVYKFISKEAFENTYMELVYQMFRTTLYHLDDKKFKKLHDKFLNFYNNEMLEKMEYYHTNKKTRPKTVEPEIARPTLLKGDSSVTLKGINEDQVQLIFTSPPYYNARLYSDYKSYNEYLEKMLEK